MAIAIEGYTQVREGKLQVALDLLHKVYINQLSKAHFDIAVDLLDAKRKALTFVRLNRAVVTARMKCKSNLLHRLHYSKILS